MPHLTREIGIRSTPGVQLSVRFIGVGLLYQAQLLKTTSGKIFYCPSFVYDATHSFQYARQPMASDESDRQSKCTYSCRSSTNNTKPTSGTYATDEIAFRETTHSLVLSFA